MPLNYEHSQSERDSNREILPEPVYYIESSDDNTVLVGMDVTAESNPDGTTTVTWYDTTRERVMTADETRNEDGYFAFKRIDEEGGQFYKFTPMNLDTYNEKVKSELIGGKDFDSKEALTEAFDKTRR